MSRPALELADLIRTAGPAFLERNRHWLRWKHIKVLRAIRRCRTAALGGHLDECTRCGHRAISYNSCRNRHCPKCQTVARDRWIQARRLQLLPTRYVHVVFTLPSQLASLALQNKKVLYGLLLRASAETLLEVARDPRHLGAEIGFFSVLHTWTQRLSLHPHVHCLIPAGGLSLDHTHWVRSPNRFFLPLKVLSRVFRGKFVAGLKQAFQSGCLRFPEKMILLAQPEIFAAWLRLLFRNDWVVYAKPPFGGPHYVLHYLGRYTHRVAISNHRLISWLDGKVTFRWRDSLTTMNRSCSPYRSTSSCAASCCICSPKASCASAISVSWPTGNVPLCCRFAFTCSAQLSNHQPNQMPHPLLPPRNFGAAPGVVDLWWSSKGSPPNKSYSVLHHRLPPRHETTLSNSHLGSSPSNCSLPVCPAPRQISSFSFLATVSQAIGHPP